MDVMARADWHRLSASRTQRCAATLAAFSALFTLCALAQVLQCIRPCTLLAPFTTLGGRLLPNLLLFMVEVFILVLMCSATLAVTSGRLAADGARGRWLLSFGALYFTVTVLQGLITGATFGAPPWTHVWLSAWFHLLLSGFVVVLAGFHLRHA